MSETIERPKCGTCDQWHKQDNSADFGNCRMAHVHGGIYEVRCDVPACLHHQNFPAYRESRRKS